MPLLLREPVIGTRLCRPPFRMNSDVLADTKSGNDQFHLQRHNRRKHVGWVILIAYSLFLVYRAHCHNTGGEAASTLLWESQDSRGLVGWIGGLVLRVLSESAYFVPLGFVVAVVVPRGSGWLRRLPISLPALVTGSALTALAYAIEIVGSQHLVAGAGLVFPWLGCLFGTWAGTTWLRGAGPRLWFLPKVASLAFLATLGTGVIVWLSLEKTPLRLEVARVTSAEKQRLVHLIRSKNPRSLREGETHTLRLTEHDVNVLLSWGLSVGSPERKAVISLGQDSVSLLMYLTTALGRGRLRYLNLALTGGVGIEDGILSLRVDRCRVGSVEVPRWFLHSLCPYVTSLVSHDRRWKPVLDATRGMTIEPDAIQLTYGPLHRPAEFQESLFSPAVASEELLASTRAQVDHLLVLPVISQLLDPEPSFGLCVETAFALARERSTQRDPVTENQAAIVALGILLGHPRIEEFLGSVPAARDHDAARQVLRRVVLRGRSDWAKHFCVSAALAILSDEAVSDAAGLLKEELDAEAGGSGFSFADLLADRAGTTFAIRATRDEASARAMQDRLARGFRVEEFFPPANDLPEGVSDAELQSCYGGVGGEGYRRLIEEIERRIVACAAYQ